MKRSICVAGVGVSLLAATACGASGMVSGPQESSAAQLDSAARATPPISIDSALAQAWTIASGTVVAVSDERITIAVDEVLRGQHIEGQISVRVPGGTGHVDAGYAGVWILGAGDPPTLIAGGPGSYTLTEVQRVLSGLPRLPEKPTMSETRELVEAADVVVIANPIEVSGDGSSAILDVLKVLKGNPGDQVTAAKALTTEDAWDFTPGIGVYFLSDRATGLVALNPVAPRLYSARTAEAAAQSQPG